MNYSFIQQLLDNGYSEEELVASLSKSLPRLAKKAQKMFFGGWSPKDVINMFSKDKEAEKISRKSLKPVTPGEIADMHLRNGYNNIPKGSSEQTKETLQDFTKQVAPLAIGALGAPMAQAALSRALPKVPELVKTALSLPQLGGNTLQQPQEGLNQNPNSNLLPTSSNTPQQPPVNQVAPNISQTGINIQPEGISNPEQYLEKLGIKDKVKELLSRGNTPEGVTAALGMKRSGEAKIDPDLLKNIEEFAKSPKEETKEKPTISKNEMVASPKGIGSIKEIRNGQAIIDIDGKLHRVKEEELESSPLPEKDLADLFDDLTAGIERETGEDVSRMVQWAGYNPETNTLQFLPHTGKLYKYSDISPEDAALLTDVLSTRKTSGQNFIGAWKKDSKSPIGAALSKLIRKLQSERGGKGNEYEETHETLYSAYEPAIEAKKKKMKKK